MRQHAADVACASLALLAACWPAWLARLRPRKSRPKQVVARGRCSSIAMRPISRTTGRSSSRPRSGRSSSRTIRKDPLAAKAQHYLGVCQLQLKQPDGGRGVVRGGDQEPSQVRAAGRHAAQPRLRASTRWRPAARRNCMPSAADTFAALIEQFPKGKYVEEALFYQGESLYAQGKKAEAVAAYERLVKDIREVEAAGRCAVCPGRRAGGTGQASPRRARRTTCS